MDTKSRNRRRKSRNIPELAALFVFFSFMPAAAASVHAIDGDTIVIEREHIRIANIDAPEIEHYKCDAELRLGLVARRRMEGLVTGGKVALIRGDHGRMKDRYGRPLARVIVDGKDAGDVLVSEGLGSRV